MKKYIAPQIKVVKIQHTDVICTSGKSRISTTGLDDVEYGNDATGKDADVKAQSIWDLGW